MFAFRQDGVSWVKSHTVPASVAIFGHVMNATELFDLTEAKIEKDEVIDLLNGIEESLDHQWKMNQYTPLMAKVS